MWCQSVVNKKSLLQFFKQQLFVSTKIGIFVTPYKLISHYCNSTLFRYSVNCSTLRNMSSSSEVKYNRLQYEKSPYLLQHATNPVDWYPWGKEAFSVAKTSNKPIFLSVGYSTCHWCHVMERESFEKVEIAEIMNEYFVNIKVDREERPDVDRLYMSYVQRTTGSGGWPMSVFLTPDLEPLFGGTYFAPYDTDIRIGLKSLLMMIGKQWKEDSAVLQQEARESSEQVKSMIRKKFASKGALPKNNVWERCFQQIARSYEERFGGFSDAPKFPQPVVMHFLFHVYGYKRYDSAASKALDMCLTTLKRMAYGGIHDHVNCGFARYSVDERWHVPHFEKMLYDQAQLACAYHDAYVITKDEFYADIVKDILKYVNRDLGHDEGGFYGAEDADSFPTAESAHKKEGAFCVWEYDELAENIKNDRDFEVFCYHYNVKREGNVDERMDPHQELRRKNVLACFESYEDTANRFSMTLEMVKSVLESCHATLYQARLKRPKPHKDTKIVTAWNGLMISGFAKAGPTLNDENYTQRAVRAAEFIKKYLFVGKDLLRCCYGSEDGHQVVQIENPIVGFLEDYAFLIRGLIDLYEATLDSSWLEWAETLQTRQDEQFWDPNGFGYFTSPSDDTSIIMRDKDDHDGAEPCGNSIAVYNLLRLAAYLGRQDMRERATQILSAYTNRLTTVPITLPEMSAALIYYHATSLQIFIAGQREDPRTKALLHEVRIRYMPNAIFGVADGAAGPSHYLYTKHAQLAKLGMKRDQPVAYICRNFACSLPVAEPKELAVSLDEAIGVKAGDGGTTTSTSDDDKK